MGSLLPEKSDTPGSIGGRNPPKFAKLYIYDTTNEVNNRINAVNPDNDKKKDIEPAIVDGLTNMFNECNDLVKKFRMASERVKGNEDEHVAIRLVAPSEGDGPQYSLPSNNHLAALLVGPLDLEAPTRDIVTDNKKKACEEFRLYILLLCPCSILCYFLLPKGVSILIFLTLGWNPLRKKPVTP
jgi:hypothetical protein